MLPLCSALMLGLCLLAQSTSDAAAPSPPPARMAPSHQPEPQSAPLRSVAVPHPQVSSIAISPDGQSLAYAAFAEDERSHIFVIPVDGGTPVQITAEPCSDSTPRFSPDGRLIAFVSDRTGNPDIFVAPVQGGPARRITDDPGADLDPDWSPDGNRIVFASNRGGGSLIYVVAATGGQVFPLTSGAGRDRRPAWSPDGQSIAYETLNLNVSEVWLVPATGGEARKVGTDKAPQQAPFWQSDSRHLRSLRSQGGRTIMVDHFLEEGSATQAPMPGGVEPSIAALSMSRNGDRVVFLSGGGSGIGIVKFGTSPGHSIFEGGINLRPSWSPDGRQILFASNRTGTWDLYSVGVASGRVRRLTETSARERAPHASPASGDLVFSLESAAGDTLQILEPETGKVIKLVSEPGHYRDPVWSEDGKWVAFSSDKAGSYDIWLVQVADNSLRRLTSTPAAETRPSWSPDGKWIVFERDEGESREIWKIAVEQPAAPERLVASAGGTEEPAQAMEPAWSPKNTWIVFARLVGQAAELYMVEPKGGKPFRVLQQTGARIARPSWSPNGEYVAYEWRKPARIQVLDLPGN